MLNIEFMQHPDVRSGPCIGSVTPGTVWIQTRSPDNRATWLWGRNPRRIIAVYTLDGIQEGLATVEKEARSGNVAVGFLAYEAAPAFDPAFSCHPPPRRVSHCSGSQCTTASKKNYSRLFHL